MNKHLYNDPTTKSKRHCLRKNTTGAEQKVWSMLRNKQIAGLKFFRQYSIGPYILGFYCPERRLAIEVDGGQHADLYGQEHDAHRDSYLAELDIRVIRFWNNDVLQNIDGAWKMIKEETEKHS
jgi:very-short-patch-repair endonuclease